ncbi:MAG: hypothetical protein D6675_13920 [Gemmatimonadetes bacterium]|nr:MAG: hypothetical protein D6675_13920 [Gemmatimonadota bacterium]
MRKRPFPTFSLSFRRELAGVVHVDGTARIQTLFQRENNPFLFDLLTYLDDTLQIPARINTLFNRRGEPIVHTTTDALQSARAMRLDAVVLNGNLTALS